MGKIIKAGAWCNGEVAYLAWQADAPIEDCLGFMITRVHETGPDAGQRRVLPTWIAFIDQSNPDWQDQDSGVWPIQQFQWRDLTLRRSRDTAAVRPIDFRVHYEIVPVGLAGDDRAAIPEADVAPFMDAAGKPRYQGPRHPLGILAAPFRTDAIDVTHRYGKAGIEATFTNGILSTQNLLRQLEAVQGSKPDGVKAGPTLGVTKGLLRTLTDHIPIENDDIRRFLTADVLSLLLKLLDRAEQGDGELFLALYELHDPQLIGRLTRLVEAGKAHVVLSTAGSTDLNAKGAAPPRIPLIWDSENHDARESLHAAGPANVEDRLFNNQQHIGHNKFIV